MYLCDNMVWQDTRVPMVGVVPGDAIMYPRPQGRGYARFRQTSTHPWGCAGVETRAHEFHYARLEGLADGAIFAREMTRGAGIGEGHDGIVIGNLVAGFCHLRSTAQDRWVERFVQFTRAHKRGP